MENKYYYELQYFYNRKNNGFIYVESNCFIAEFIEEDDFLNALVNENAISESEAYNVTVIRRITENEYYENKRPI